MYVPLEGRLVLGVIKASNLRAMDINGSSGNECLLNALKTIIMCAAFKKWAP